MPKPLSILTVDDNESHLALLFDYLDGQGHTMLVAEDGESCTRIAKTAQPDIILMDSLLAGMDGYEVCRQLRRQESLKDTPIYLMSGKDDHHTKAESYEAGATGEISKPIIYQELDSILKLQAELKFLKQAQLNQVNRSEDDNLDAVIDFIVHDIRSPLACITGFAVELNDELTELTGENSGLCHEYLNIICQSTANAERILDALVLVKNLRGHHSSEQMDCDLTEVVSSVRARYEKYDWEKPITLSTNFGRCPTLTTMPTLLEEMLLIFVRNLGALTREGEDYNVSIASSVEENQTRLTLRANTRELSETDIEYLLEPMLGKKRRRIQDVNIQTICSQKIIQLLTINAWGHYDENKLTLTFSFPNSIRDNR